MLRLGFQDKNGKVTLTADNLKYACKVLDIPDDKHTLRRAARAFDLYHSGKIEHISRKAFALSGESHRVDHTFNVKSQYTERLPYQVHISAVLSTEKRRSLPRSKSGVSYCTCPDWMNYSGDMDYPDVHFHCKHAIAARVWLHNNNGNGKRVVNECGTETAKALQDKLNGDGGNNGSNANNGNGGNHPPSHDLYQMLDPSNPFDECELRDIEQIEGKGNGEPVHHLSNGEYIISYKGIMALAEKHSVVFEKHKVHKSERTGYGEVIAYARLGNNTRMSGKPLNGDFVTAIELAKRNATRQLLPLPEIKALEKKAQLEAEFSWEQAKAKCLELVPNFKLDILIHDLVQADTLRQAHPSDYNRKEWLLIFDACKRDRETNGNDDDDDNNGDGDNPSPNNEREAKFTECRNAAKNFVRFSWLKDDMLKDGTLSGDWTDDNFAKLKEACEIDASLFGKELGHWEIDIQPNANAPWRYNRRYLFWLIPMSKRCFWCAKTEGVMPDTFIHWRRYEIKTSLCLECSQKVGKGELDKDAIVQKFDGLYKAYGGTGSSRGAMPPKDGTPSANIFPPNAETVPNNADEFVERCKEAEAEVMDDNSVDVAEGEPSARTAEAMPLENENGAGGLGTDGTAKRVLKMNKKREIWVEEDGKKTSLTIMEASNKFGGNAIMRLTQGIMIAGADISREDMSSRGT